MPLACGLSGGLDSQAIVSMLVKNNIKINTFTLGFQSFGEGDLNELKVAKTAADFFKTNHHEMIVETKNYFNDLDKMIYHLDEPYWWTFVACIGNTVKFGVILTGLGGDELFGNFGRWTLLGKFNLFQINHFDIFF